MFRSHTVFAVIGVALLVLLGVIALPTLAQTGSDSGGFPQDTITVTGTGTVPGTPDIATVDVGVEVVKPTVPEAFTEANTKVQDIIDALTGMGIAPEDIQTSNLSVYSTTTPNPDTGNNENAYDVSNTVHVIVRDVTKVEEVINSAIDAGATSLYGLNFDIQDRSALESQARQLAMQDAAARAQDYATLINAQLSDVVVINETQIGGQPVALYSRAGGGNATVALGQTNVQIQVTVTYRIAR